MRIQQIKICELLDFVHSKEYQESDIVPITHARAKSQMLNPRANADDIVLTVAYNDQNKLIAYVGALPDTLNDSVRIAWNSCWWASAGEGSNVALPLFLQFVKDYNSKIILQDLTPHTTQIIQALPNFKCVETKAGKRVFLRSCITDILIQKFPQSIYFKPLFQAVDVIGNLVQDYRLRTWSVKVNKGLRLERIRAIDSEAEDFIKSFHAEELVQRGKRELEWILDHKWVNEGRVEEDVYRNRYHFTSTVKQFKYHLLKLKSNDTLLAVVLLRQRDNSLETPYVYVQKGSEDACMECVLSYAISLKVNTLTSFNKKLTLPLTRMNVPYLHCRTINRDIVLSTALLDEIGDKFELQDGDGDVVFT